MAANPTEPAGALRDVLLTAAEVRQLRELLGRDPRAAEVARACILQPAQQACQRPLFIPPPHPERHPRLFDPDTGQAMRFDPDQPHRHASVTGALLVGPSYDRGWCCVKHNVNANDARNCALAAVLFDDVAAAQRARDLLLGYAEVYLDHVPNGRLTCSWGRLFAQGLEEAVWSISMLWATELLWKRGDLTLAELDRLRVRIFEPVVDLLWGEWYFIHNIRMWCNAAIGSIGLAFDDRHAKRHAITGDKGFRQQLIDGFRSDGLLFEGSPGYHDYAASAMLVLAEAMARNGYEPYRDDHLRRLLMVTALMVQPDGSLPPLNDYGLNRGLATRLYGTALRRYDDPQVRAVAAQAFAQWRRHGMGPDFSSAAWNCTTAYHARQQVDWLLAWDRLDESLTHQPPTVVDLRASGVGILRPKPGSYLLLKCSAKGSGHDHHDKLSFIWWHEGVRWLADLGTTNYALPLHEQWFKTTLAHHTVLVDTRKHERTDATLTQCQPDALAGAAQPYPTLMPDVRMTRQLRSRGDHLVDELRVNGSEPRVIDYALLPAGVLEMPADASLKPAALPGLDPCYSVLRDVRLVHFAGARQLSWRQGSARLTIDLEALDEQTQVFVALAPMDVQQFDTLGTMLVLRTHGTAATFRVTLSAGQVAGLPGPTASPTAALGAATAR